MERELPNNDGQLVKNLLFALLQVNGKKDVFSIARNARTPKLSSEKVVRLSLYFSRYNKFHEKFDF